MSVRGKRQVDISILEPVDTQLSRAWLRKIVTYTLGGVNYEESYRIGLVLADDDTVRDLNREYRGLDESTDVLSFSHIHQGHWEGENEPPDNDVPFIQPAEEVTHLGEVIISIPRATIQAKDNSRTLKEELTTLTIHGVLHLLGFDHVQPSDQASMQAKEREIVSLISS